MKRRAGYILVEAVVSLAVLSIGVFTMQAAIRQTLVVRGTARDYTAVRFLLERLITEMEWYPELLEGKRSGAFSGDYSRFKYEVEVVKVPVPKPPPPPNMTPDKEKLRLPVEYVPRITATIRWERAGLEHEERMETMVPPERLYVPPPPQPGAR